MTNEERLIACEMRLKYYDWDEIGDELGYTEVTVREDLFKHIFHCRIKGNHGVGKYPAIKAWTRMERISLAEFAEILGYTHTYVSKVLNGIFPLTETFIERVCKVTGLPREEAFTTEKEKVPH